MRFWIIFILCFFCAESSLASSYEVASKLDASFEASQLRDSRESELLRPRVEPGMHWELNESSPAATVFPKVINASFRIERNYAKRASSLGQDRTEVALRELNASWRGDTLQTTIGLQQIVWGETFGVPIVDLIQPSDFRENPLSDPVKTRLPQWAINQQYFSDSFSVQWLLIPIAQKPSLPATFQGIDVTDGEKQYEWGRDSEWGIRAGQLFSFGLDAKIFTLTHHDRYPNFLFDPISKSLVLEQPMVRSYGVSYSYAWSDFVYRSDSLYQDHESRIRLVQGVDYSLGDGWNLGIQIHGDRGFYEDPTTKQKPWLFAASARMIYDPSKIFFMRAFYFDGLNSKDYWASGTLGLHVNRWVDICLRGDWIEAEKTLLLAKDSGRYLGEVTLQF